MTVTTPTAPVGLTFGGSEKRTLFIISQSAIYSIAITAQGETINGAQRGDTKPRIHYTQGDSRRHRPRGECLCSKSCL